MGQVRAASILEARLLVPDRRPLAGGIGRQSSAAASGQALSADPSATHQGGTKMPVFTELTDPTFSEKKALVSKLFVTYVEPNSHLGSKIWIFGKSDPISVTMPYADVKAWLNEPVS